MSDFEFLKRLDSKLYRRYNSIEDSIKNHNGNVYLNMQIYLEHLFKFVSKRQGYNIHMNKKLGELLNDYRIENFCLIKIEYNKLNVFKTINHYGNNYKHNEILDLRMNEIIGLMNEIYTVSVKIFNYYEPDHRINLHLNALDETYFQELLDHHPQLEQRLNKLEIELYIAQKEIKDKDESLTVINQEVLQLREENKKLRRETKKRENHMVELQKRLDQKEQLYYTLKYQYNILKQMIDRQFLNERVFQPLNINLIEQYDKRT